MDARGCRGCNAKEGKVCWSFFLGEQAPKPIKELKECPDPAINMLDKLDNAFAKLEQLFHELAEQQKN